LAAHLTKDGDYLPIPTERELQCIERVAQGMAYKEVARALGIQYATVKTHIEGLYRRLDASNAAQAYRICLERGYIELWQSTERSRQ